MPNFELYGLLPGDMPTEFKVRTELAKAIGTKWPNMVPQMVITNAQSTVISGDGKALPFVRVCSSEREGIPFTTELVTAIKPTCDKLGLDIEWMRLDGFCKKGQPLPFQS